MAARSGAPSSPGRDLGRLARALGVAAGGAAVSAGMTSAGSPPSGPADDLLFGRWALFLARAPGDDTRDVWRARVRLTPEGQALDVSAAHDLTATPLGDDHQLVVRGTHAAFATRAYGQEQSVTVLDLAGEGAQNKAVVAEDRVMAAITSLMQDRAPRGSGPHRRHARDPGARRGPRASTRPRSR